MPLGSLDPRSRFDKRLRWILALVGLALALVLAVWIGTRPAGRPSSAGQLERAQSAATPGAATSGASTTPSSPLASDPAVARGRYLAAAGDCVSCHTRPGGAPYSGGRAFATPFGTLYSSNITPDAETGIGRWTAADLRRAMQEGIAAGGNRLFPAFPYTFFTKVADRDIDAIYAFLRTVQPQRYRPPGNGILLRQRWAIAAWNSLYFKPGRFVADPGRSAEWNRGAYLVEGLGHCSACHTPRNFAMAEQTARAYGGGTLQDEVAKGRIRRWSAVNITSAKVGIASWSIDDVAKYLHSGVSRRAGVFGPMNEVIVNSTMQLSPEDLHAMAVYLKSLSVREYQGPTVAPEQAQAGAPIYQARCEKCHGASGRGGFFSGPPLAGSAVVQGEDPASLINIILYGAVTPQQVSFGAWESMKPYAQVLTDAEVAAVANYVRGSWKNQAPPVTVDEVAGQR